MLGSRHLRDDHGILWGRLDEELVGVVVPEPIGAPDHFDLCAYRGAGEPSRVPCEIDDLFDLVDVLRGRREHVTVGAFLPRAIRHATRIARRDTLPGTTLVVGDATVRLTSGEMSVIADDLRRLSQIVFASPPSPSRSSPPLSSALATIPERAYPMRARERALPLSACLFGARPASV